MGLGYLLAGSGEGSRLTESRALTAGLTGICLVVGCGQLPRGINGGRRLLPSLAWKVSQKFCLVEGKTPKMLV